MMNRFKAPRQDTGPRGRPTTLPIRSAIPWLAAAVNSSALSVFTALKSPALPVFTALRHLEAADSLREIGCVTPLASQLRHIGLFARLLERAAGFEQTQVVGQSR